MASLQHENKRNFPAPIPQSHGNSFRTWFLPIGLGLTMVSVIHMMKNSYFDAKIIHIIDTPILDV
jgi:hypothetical protein